MSAKVLMYACVSSSVLPGKKPGRKCKESETGKKDGRDSGPDNSFT